MDYKKTLNLPTTEFPMKADLPKREPEILRYWETIGLYQAIQQARAGKPIFLLHDGPPYANGDIHIGHALNKILKDVIVRYKTMRGYASPYVPGWDCHGMPIEHQLFKELGLTKHGIQQAVFREKAKAYAARYVGIQRDQFKRLGVSGDWEHPYLTMDQAYERVIIQTFGELVRAGYIYRGLRPVSWCATCETALADAEVEYEDRQDVSIYVKCEIEKDSIRTVLQGLTTPGAGPSAAGPQATRRFFFLIWTTTPWTLPANVAVALHPQRLYQLVEVGKDEVWIVAADRVSILSELGGSPVSPKAGWNKPGSGFVGVRYTRPCAKGVGQAVTSEFVSMEEGTGIVHIAPGHGHEDYQIGKREGLEVLSPVDHQGRFTKEVPQWAGQVVTEANPKIIKELSERKLLLHEESLTHSYPHCWRCKQPLIFRATPQWFLGVDREGLRERLIKAARGVQWIPSTGAGRIQGMLAHRPDWCLSRQRYWGTPIPVLHCVACEAPVLDPAVMERIERTLTERGTEAWFTSTVEELFPDVVCPSCRGSRLQKDPDILDVWFDSGVSHEAVLKARQDLTWPASLYLEGSDQHRGWFQVSLIPAIALRGRAPYQQVLTHGFVVDGDGRKMSKSLGNVIAPKEVIERSGAEILRLWVAASDYREDVRISGVILEHMGDAYRKFRNTIRFLLANLYDFQPDHDTPSLETWPDIDRWALQRAQGVLERVTEAYEAYQFHVVFRVLAQYCVLDLSQFYLDALKDRLYTEAPGAPRRRCAQAALYAILGGLVRMLAPILPMTSEQAWQEMRKAGWVKEASVHLAPWPERIVAKADEALGHRWETFLEIREEVMKALEGARSAQRIKSPLEAQVTLLASDPQLAAHWEEYRETLAEACVVSEIQVVHQTKGHGGKAGGPDGVTGRPPGGGTKVAGLSSVQIARVSWPKCQRCWKYLRTVGEHRDHPQLCAPCAAIVTEGNGSRRT